ncbi:MAG TPA: glycosyltransferase family 39 protein [Polyangiaceae bacterium]|nr:glycosyltransferase family 39 protein [Polyangiaceae bacterium]
MNDAETSSESSGDARMRWLPGFPVFLGFGTLTFLLMANMSHLRGGVALGALTCLMATVGLLDWIGCFEFVSGVPTRDAHPSLARSVLGTVVAFVAFVLVTRFAVAGTLPGGKWISALLIPALLLLTLTMLYRAIADLGVFEPEERSPQRHPSFWLLALTVAIYTPMLGSFSLIDPWETHYGEVAREILSRDDWISLWWAQDGWFWSKPVLDFWLQALSFALFDVNYAPDGMIAAVAQGRAPYPEWAARLPILLLSLIGQVLLYLGVRRVWGRRPALLGSLVLVSAPHYAIIVHQSMTDLPYIAALTGAMGLMLLGLFTPAEQLARGYAMEIGRRRVVVSAQTLVVGAIILFSLPQILYLISRNLGLVTAGTDLGFYPHLDRFFSGSGGGNCGLPGNESCSAQLPANDRPQPAVCAAFWSAILACFLWVNRGERRSQRLAYLGAWILFALSFMAKGLPGPVIFIASITAVLFLLRRVGEFDRLELPSAVLIFAAVALPWFVQMTIRHGPGFLDRLFIHDMYKRAFVHVHDTNAGDDTSIRYYLWQLGYGLFPATGLVGFTAFASHWGAREHKHRAQATASFLLVWFWVGFAMFTLTLTKFHHYIIAVVPPLCLLSGRYLSSTLEGFEFRQVLRARSWRDALRSRARRTDAPGVRALWVTSAILVTWFVGLDLFRQKAPNGPVRLINLVTYSYTRPWPPHLSLSQVLFASTVAAMLATLLWIGPARIRWFGTVAFLGVCLGVCAWICNVYLPAIAPHWGQRETVAEYYRRRHGPEELLVSYQMNWKGENFYTGNRTPAFLTTGENFKRFIEEQRNANRRVLFFVLEPSRIGYLKGDLGKVARLDLVTDARVNNKFVLARVEL